MSCRRVILILSAFLISMFANPPLIDARTSSWHGQQRQQNSNFAFVCLPQSMLSMNSEDKSIHLQNEFRTTIHPRKSANVLEFWSRKRAYDHDAAASDNSQYQPSPISREYKTDDEEDVPLQLPEQSEIGIVLYTANQTANNEVNEISTLAVAAAAGNATRISKRSMLASSLRSLRPLIVPPWMLPFISNERDESICTLDEKDSSMILSSSSEVAIAVPNITSNKLLNVSDQLPLQISNVIDAEIESHSGTLESDETQMIPNEEQIERTSKRRFFRRQHDRNAKRNKAVVTKEEATCPVIVSNIHELRDAVLVNKIPLRDVGFRFPVNGIGSEILSQSGSTAGETGVSLYIDDVPNEEEKQETPPEAETVFQRHDPVINGTLSSLLTCGSDASFNRNSTYYQQGIDLLSNHPVLSLVQERVKTNSTPGNRLPTDDAHLALVIEGGGMRGAVSAGMAAALSTLDLLDTFDSVHGSSAGAIIGAYVVSRQLCTDVYTE